MALRWCQGAALSGGLLLSALTVGSRSYAENPAEPDRSDSTEETPQKPTTRAPSLLPPRVYSATKTSLGGDASNVRTLRAGEASETALGEARDPETGERSYRATAPPAPRARNALTSSFPLRGGVGGAHADWRGLLGWLVLQRWTSPWLFPTSPTTNRPGLLVVDPQRGDELSETTETGEFFRDPPSFSPGLWAW